MNIDKKYYSQIQENLKNTLQDTKINAPNKKVGKVRDAYFLENKVLMVADSNCNFTKSIGADINLGHKGLGIRSSRYAMLVEKGKVIKISKEEVAGKCEATAAENFLKNI